MLKPKTKPKTETRHAAGMHAGVLELASDDGGRYKVRLLDGRLVDARLAPGVSPALAAECLRDRRTVLLGDGVLLGALQTEASAATRDVDGSVRIVGVEATIDCEHAVTLRVGDSALELHADGSVRVVGQRLSMDVAALIKLLSAKVELP